jgi:hypothetical protein
MRTFYQKLHPVERSSKYQWPADKLTDKEMAILYQWRQKTKTPINHLLRQAIEQLDRIIKGVDNETIHTRDKKQVTKAIR